MICLQNLTLSNQNMNRTKQSVCNSSNLFCPSTKNQLNINLDIDRFKNYYQRVSNVIGLTIVKSNICSLKQNQQPSIKAFKIRSVRGKSSLPVDIAKQQLKTFFVKLKQLKIPITLNKSCQRTTYKQNKVIKLQDKQNLLMIINASLFINPKKLVQKQSKDHKDIGKNQSSNRFKDQIIQFLSHLRNSGLAKSKIIFKTRNQQQCLQLIQYLAKNKIQYNGCFYFSKRVCETFSMYNLDEMILCPDNVIVLEDNSEEITLPFTKKNINFVSLNMTDFMARDDKWSIESINEFTNQIKINANTCNLIKQSSLIEKIKIASNGRFRKRIKRSRCKSTGQIKLLENIESTVKMQDFKDKMVKYIRILQQQRKQKDNPNFYCSKTPNQVISELIRLNIGNAKQIQRYQDDILDINIDNLDQDLDASIPMYNLS